MHAMADNDDQRVRGGQCGRTDAPNLVPRIPVGELVGRFGPKQRREGGRGVVLARSRQVRNPRRDRGVRSGGGNVDPVDLLVVELVR